jgi:hypothetical protein
MGLNGLNARSAGRNFSSHFPVASAAAARLATRTVLENIVCFFNLLQSRQIAIFIFDNNAREQLYFLLRSFSV